MNRAADSGSSSAASPRPSATRSSCRVRKRPTSTASPPDTARPRPSPSHHSWTLSGPACTSATASPPTPSASPAAPPARLYQLKAVVPLRGAAADDWWARQAESSGLNLGTLHSTPLDAARGDRRSDQRPVKHDRVLFEGTAVITDADRLRTRLTDGIGKGKAYGCGLLSIAPHRGPQ